jgi:phytoene dehydrogenase-like protein
LDINEDRDYFMKKVFPWMFKYAVTAPKISKKTTPVEAYLRNFTKNQALLDVIAQHFFVQTPAYFALSYFRLYQDYFYPKHGTGVFIKKMIDLIEKKGGEIRTNLEVQSIDLDEKEVYLSDNQKIKFNQLVWAADQKTLYDVIDVNVLKDKEIAENVNQKRELLKNLHGNDSVLTIYLSSNLEPMYFEKISAGHFFYTPSRKGQTSAGPIPQKSTWEEVKAWLNQFCALTTYEISIPVLRDASLAPEGKTGLIVSILFDFKLTKYIYDQGWYALFEDFIKTLIINVLDQSIYPGLKNSIIRSMITTPLTLFQMTGNFEGAITGWSFKNRQMPSENRLVKIANSVKTSLPNVVQAGQWTYSPSGFPVSLITGKLAADAVNKRLKK